MSPHPIIRLALQLPSLLCLHVEGDGGAWKKVPAWLQDRRTDRLTVPRARHKQCPVPGRAGCGPSPELIQEQQQCRQGAWAPEPPQP